MVILFFFPNYCYILNKLSKVHSLLFLFKIKKSLNFFRKQKKTKIKHIFPLDRYWKNNKGNILWTLCKKCRHTLHWHWWLWQCLLFSNRTCHPSQPHNLAEPVPPVCREWLGGNMDSRWYFGSKFLQLITLILLLLSCSWNYGCSTRSEIALIAWWSSSLLLEIACFVFVFGCECTCS